MFNKFIKGVATASLLVCSEFMVHSCTSEAQSETNSVATAEVVNSTKPAAVDLLVLVDKSASVNFTHEQVDYLPSHLHEVINNMPSGSRYGIFFINSVPMSKAFAVGNVNAKEPEGNGGGITNQQEQDRYKRLIGQCRNNCKESVKTALKVDSGRSAKYETDIWGCLDGISRFYQEGNSSGKKFLYIYSDMIHADSRINLHRKGPKDISAARTLAQQHLSEMKQFYKLPEDVLKNVQIHIIYPGTATQANKNNLMTAYWKEAFAGLGARDVRFE